MSNCDQTGEILQKQINNARTLSALSFSNIIFMEGVYRYDFRTYISSF